MPTLSPRSPPPVPVDMREGSYLAPPQIADHASAFGVPRRMPAPVPPPGPNIQSDPLSDLPTRPLALPPEPVAFEPSALLQPMPTLAPPPSWPDDEGTAALLLTEPTPLPRPGVRLPERRERPKAQWPRTLLKGLLGIGVLLLLLFAGLRLARYTLKEPPIAAAQQQLIDEALRAVQHDQLDQAIDRLQRFQSASPNSAIDLMIRSLKQQSVDQNANKR